MRGVYAVPGALALLGGLFQILRDTIAFDRRHFLQSDQQLFNLAASSYMSQVAFDKHVGFCEAYMSEVHVTLGTLFREGPTSSAMGCAQRLFALKREYAAWLPKRIALKLEPFEHAVNKIGVKVELTKALGTEDRDARSKAINDAYALFANVMGLGPLRDTDPEQKEEIAVENVMEELRSILGINDLLAIRSFIISRSAKLTRTNA